MKQRYRIVLLGYICSLLIFTAKAQQENVWIFGSHGGVDFNTTPSVSLSSSINSSEACASVCDNEGELLFYTDGNKVWDKNHNLMANGATLITDILYSEEYGPTTSSFNGALIVPFINDVHKYYIFSITSIELGGNYGRLYYSVVNMELNDGLGDVESGEKGILVDSQNTEHLTAVVGDRCNIWVITTAIPDGNTELIKSYEVTEEGVNSTPVTSSFEIPFSLGTSLGQMDASSDRKKLVVTRGFIFSPSGKATELFSFDPATGLASDHILLDTLFLGFGVAFSPDNSKLYISPGAAVYQYDLSLGNVTDIINSLTLIGSANVSMIKRGPDGKMYFAKYMSQGILSAISNPNLAGLASGFVADAITLNTNTNVVSGLPNIVPVITHDTFYHADNVSASCFAANTSITALNDTTGWDYVWSTGASGATTNVSSAGTYWVSYRTPPCNFNVDTFHVFFETRLPVIVAIAGCYHESNGTIRTTPFMGDTVTYTYTWMDADSVILQGPLATSIGDTLATAVSGNIYYLNITAPNGCDTTLEIMVPMPDYAVSFSPSDTIVCIDEEVSFQNTSTEDIVGFSWHFGDGNTSGEENPQHAYVAAGLYTMQLIGSTGYSCYDTAYQTIIVDNMVTGSIVTDRDSICTGETIVFTPLEEDSTIVSRDWYFGDSSYVLHAGHGSWQHAYDMNGMFPVRLSTYSRACPEAVFTDTMYVFPMPVVNLGDDTSLCLQGNPLFLQNFYVDTALIIRSLTWSTGDTATTLKVVHPDTYSLTMKTEPIGCSTTDVIEVKKDCYIDVPNAFTPNGDGVNDYFFPRQYLSKHVTGFKMQVFNRWGEVVFETTNTDGRGWDGRYNNQDQPGGVYIYIIDVMIEGTKPEHYTGNVTLLR